MKDLFHGTLVRLAIEEPALLAGALVRWSRNTAFHRLLDSAPQDQRSPKHAEKWMDKMIEELVSQNLPDGFPFSLRALPEEKLIGFLGLWDVSWTHGNCFVAIGLGEPEYWGKGYGTEAMQLALRYAFTELNLHRVTLGVFEYNLRAIRSYEKAGFRFEGRQRGVLDRDGKRYDEVMMGVLRDEWLAAQPAAASFAE